MAVPNLALFDIDSDGQDRGFESSGDTSHALRLRRQPPIGITSVVFQVFDPNAFVADDAIASNPPRASTDAPTLTLSGATAGQRVSPSTVDGSVSVNVPGGDAASWIIRCVVNGGVKTLPNGVQVMDPSLVHERGLYVAGDGELRKPVATEVGQFHVDGWAEVIASMVDKVLANVTGITTLGVGAVFATFLRRSQNEVWVTDFMSSTAQADAFNCTVSLDLQPVIQAAIDYALFRNSTGISGGPRVRLPGGVLRIDRPINVCYGNNDLRSASIEGEGVRFGGNNGNVGQGTSIIPTFNNAPAIVVQGAQHSQLRDFSIFGPMQPFVNTVLNTPVMANLNVSAWIDPAFPASASAQFSVQCGIAIDPYSGAQPGVHYPAAVYPSFLGTVAQYNKSPSSNILIENVRISGCVAGIAIQPCNFDGNGDFVTLRKVTVNFCAYGFVWGNSQARDTHLVDCVFDAMHTVLDNMTFGKQIGDGQIQLEACQANRLIQVANMTLNGVGPLFSQFFAEAIYRLGSLGVGASFSGSTQFNNCEFGMSYWDQYGVPMFIYANGATQAMATFRQCKFFVNALVNAWGGIHMTRGGQQENGASFRFEDCDIVFPSGDPTQLWQKCALNATAGLSISTLNTRFQDYGWRLAHRYNLSTGADLGVALYGKLNFGSRDMCLPAYGSKAVGSQFGADLGVDITWRTGGPTATGAIAVSGRNITATWNGSWNADAANRLGGDVGDVIEDAATGTVYWIYTRTGNVIGARAMNNFDSSGNLLAPPASNQGFYGLNCRRYMASGTGGEFILYGDLTAGSPTISNVVNGSGATVDASTWITAGDWLYQEKDIDKLFVSDAACKISSIASGSITMAGNAVRSATHHRLALFTRAPMPNGTATP
jgi:hypothetical protein